LSSVRTILKLPSTIKRSERCNAIMETTLNVRSTKQKLQSINPNTKKSKTSSTKVKDKAKTNQAMLDSGSDDDLLFHQHGTHKCFPYLTRQVPKPWCTSNGNFHTEGSGNLEIKFFEYSNSKVCVYSLLMLSKLGTQRYQYLNSS
jgi:hypothetical protein